MVGDYEGPNTKIHNLFYELRRLETNNDRRYLSSQEFYDDMRVYRAQLGSDDPEGTISDLEKRIVAAKERTKKSGLRKIMYGITHWKIPGLRRRRPPQDQKNEEGGSD